MYSGELCSRISGSFLSELMQHACTLCLYGYICNLGGLKKEKKEER